MGEEKSVLVSLRIYRGIESMVDWVFGGGVGFC